MEVGLWQYLILILFALAVLAGIIYFTKHVLWKLLGSVIWIIVAGFLLTQVFRVA